MKNKVQKFFLYFFLIVFTGCTISEKERSDIITVIELRENALNKGDIKSYRALLSDSFENLNEHMEQLKLRNQYLRGFVYIFTSTRIDKVSSFGKRADVVVEFDLEYQRPDDPAPHVWLKRQETISFVKDPVGWRISGVKDKENSGTMIEPKTVHGIYHALDTRISALNNGDIELFETVVDDNYSGRKELISNFKANQEVFSDINYQLDGRRLLFISDTMDEARVEQIYSLSFKIKDFENHERFKNQKEIISLRRDGRKGFWTITDGLR